MKYINGQLSQEISWTRDGLVAKIRNEYTRARAFETAPNNIAILSSWIRNTQGCCVLYQKITSGETLSFEINISFYTSDFSLIQVVSDCIIDRIRLPLYIFIQNFRTIGHDL